jgi:hypothetical protein
MPLARIITKSTDDSLELSMQLRSRGFRVETVDPDRIPNGPADLEVCLEECAPEDVLTKAALVKESEDLWVFVAPGALDERSRPMRLIPLIPQVAEMRTQEVVAAAVAEIRPKVEVAVVDGKGPALEPEDDPILCELAARQIEIVESPKPISQIEAIPISVVAVIPDAKPKAVAESVVEVKAQAAPVSKSVSLERIRKIAVRRPLVSDIPLVPERVEPRLILQLPAPVKTKRRFVRKSYKVSFQSGPKLWRTASVTLALTVLAALLATVVAVRPPMPATRKANTSANPPIFLPAAQASTGKSSTAAASSQVTGSTAAGEKKVTASKDAARPADPSTHPAAVPRRRSSSEDGIVAEDTVTFYNRRPAPPRQPKLPPASDVKRYSDTN